MRSLLFEKIFKENFPKIDRLMKKVFDNLDTLLLIIKRITHKDLLNESKEGTLNSVKIQKCIESNQQLFNKITHYINNGKNPHISQTNEFIYFINEDIPIILKVITKVFRNYHKLYDDQDKKDLYNACVTYKQTTDNLREILGSISNEYDLPRKFNLPYKLENS
jgi:hypothetical protein